MIGIIVAIIAKGWRPVILTVDRDPFEPRLYAVARIIRGAVASIHDCSYDRLDPHTKLPRFNMFVELGTAIHIHAPNGQTGSHRLIVMTRSLARLRKAASDLNQFEIFEHQQTPSGAVGAVRKGLFRLGDPIGPPVEDFSTVNDTLQTMYVSKLRPMHGSSLFDDPQLFDTLVWAAREAFEECAQKRGAAR